MTDLLTSFGTAATILAVVWLEVDRRYRANLAYVRAFYERHRHEDLRALRLKRIA